MMIFFRFLRFFVILSLVLLFPLTNALAGSDLEANDNNHYKWFLTVYGGPHAQPDFYHVLRFDMSFEDDTYIAVAALARELYRYKDWVSFEVEGQVGKYFGREHQGQLTGLIIGRWHRFPWDKYIDTSFALGEGVSWNTEVSQVEKEDDEEAIRWLNYVLVEVTFGLPEHPRWSLVYRIHHRSSTRGLIGAGGSNFVTGGIKFSF
jgi:hypothetical protein